MTERKKIKVSCVMGKGKEVWGQNSWSGEEKATGLAVWCWSCPHPQTAMKVCHQHQHHLLLSLAQCDQSDYNNA